MKWNGEIIIFDFEVFKYDTLLGAILIKNEKQETFQIWNLEQIKKFFYIHEEAMWIGHNNLFYDNIILDAILKNKNVYETSLKIINSRYRPFDLTKFISYDLMNGSFFSLKAISALLISTPVFLNSLLVSF